MGKLLEVWIEHHTKAFGRLMTGTCPNDPLTAAEAAGFGFARYVNGRMAVRPQAQTTLETEEAGLRAAGASVEVGRFLGWMSGFRMNSKHGLN